MSEHNNSIQREQFNPNKGDRPKSPRNTDKDGDAFKQELNDYINALTYDADELDGLDSPPEHTGHQNIAKELTSNSSKSLSPQKTIDYDPSIVENHRTPLQDANKEAELSKKTRTARLSDLLSKGKMGTISKEDLG